MPRESCGLALRHRPGPEEILGPGDGSAVTRGRRAVQAAVRPGGRMPLCRRPEKSTWRLKPRPRCRGSGRRSAGRGRTNSAGSAGLKPAPGRRGDTPPGCGGQDRVGPAVPGATRRKQHLERPIRGSNSAALQVGRVRPGPSARTGRRKRPAFLTQAPGDSPRRRDPERGARAAQARALGRLFPTQAGESLPYPEGTGRQGGFIWHCESTTTSRP